jgi:hypothetical protein
MKTPFYNQKREYVVQIFPSEFCKKQGFYFELVHRTLEPMTPDRKVYRVTPNENYYNDYEMSPNGSGSYMVPVNELRIVNPSSIAISGKSALLNGNNSIIDQVEQPFTDMTIRDFYAIIRNKPVSNKSWLNELIKSHQTI